MRRSGPVVCASGVLLRRKRNQWVRTNGAVRGRKQERYVYKRLPNKDVKVSFTVHKFTDVQYEAPQGLQAGWL